jgi:hypothetical protein
VDDDEPVRESVEGLLNSVGFRVGGFSALASCTPPIAGTQRADAWHERSRTSAEVDREPAFDLDHVHYGAWR